MSLKNDINLIMSRIISSESISEKKFENFTNGVGYIQHDINTINDITKEIIELAYKHGYYTINKDLYEETLKNLGNPFFRQNSIVGRYLEGNVFNNSWPRLMRIDYTGREFGQVYYALYPDKSKLEKLNKYFRNEIINKLLD